MTGTNAGKILLKNNLLLKIVSKMLIFAVVGFNAETSLCSPVAAKEVDSIDHLLNLEKTVWTAPDHLIDDLKFKTTKAIQKDPGSSFYHYLHGQLLVRSFMINPYDMQILRQAAELGQQAIDLNPNKDFGYALAAQVLDIMGYSENALRLIDPVKNLKIRPTWRTKFLTAKIQSGSVTVEKSLGTLQNAIEKPHSQPEIIVPYVIALIESRFVGEEKVKLFKEWAHRFPQITALKISTATSHTDLKQYQAAAAMYDQMIAEDRKFATARINQAILSYRFLGQDKKAEKLLRDTVNLPLFSELPHSKQVLTKAHLAAVNLKLGRLDQARRDFVEVIKNSEDATQWIDFAHQAYRRQDKLTDFTNVLDDLSLVLSGTGDFFALFGSILSEDLGEHNSALEVFANAILLEPSRSEFYNGMGLAYYRTKKLDKALELFHQATKVDPGDATARYNEACALALLGRKIEALGSLKEAITLDPSLIQVALNDVDFEKIRDHQSFADITRGSTKVSSILP